MNIDVATESLRIEFDLPHTAEKIWRALTEPQLLAKWLMQTDMVAEEGHAFTFRMEPSEWWDGIVNCEVLEVEKNRKLRYTWQSGPASSPLDTIVTWTLQPHAGGTLLILDHTGFVRKNKFAFEGAKQGWQHNVGDRMRQLLDEID